MSSASEKDPKRVKAGRRARLKGSVFERLVARALSMAGITARRSAQRRAAHDAPDVIVEDLPFLWIEAKHYSSAPNIYNAVTDSIKTLEKYRVKGKMLCVVSRQDYRPILVSFQLEDFIKILRALKALKEHGKEKR